MRRHCGNMLAPCPVFHSTVVWTTREVSVRPYSYSREVYRTCHRQMIVDLDVALRRRDRGKVWQRLVVWHEKMAAAILEAVEEAVVLEICHWAEAACCVKLL